MKDRWLATTKEARVYFYYDAFNRLVQVSQSSAKDLYPSQAPVNPRAYPRRIVWDREHMLEEQEWVRPGDKVPVAVRRFGWEPAGSPRATHELCTAEGAAHRRGA